MHGGAGALGLVDLSKVLVFGRRTRLPAIEIVVAVDNDTAENRRNQPKQRTTIMNKKLTTAVLALLVAGGGIASAGSLVANAYDTTDPTADTTTIEPTIETTVDNDGVPQALTAQVETDTDTDTDTDTAPRHRRTPPTASGPTVKVTDAAAAVAATRPSPNSSG